MTESYPAPETVVYDGNKQDTTRHWPWPHGIIISKQRRFFQDECLPAYGERCQTPATPLRRRLALVRNGDRKAL